MTLLAPHKQQHVPLIRLLPLAVAVFAMVTGGMVIGGMLPDLARSLRVSEPTAGQLLTAYAIVTALGAPIIATLTARVSRRRLLIGGLVAFVLLNALSAAAPNYPTLLVARIFAACASATVFPVALAAAAALAPPERRGRYVALVTAGGTASLVLGSPIGTWLGGAYGWPSTMLFVAGAGLVAMIGLAALPEIETEATATSIRERLALLRRPELVRAFAASMAIMTGAVMLTAYLRPVLRAASGAEYKQAAVVLSVAGLAGITGAWLGGRAIDRWGATRVLRLTIAGHGAAILACGALAYLGGVPLALSALAVMGVSLFGWALNPALQVRMLDLAPAAGSEVMAVNGSVGQLGAAIATATGGLLLGGLGAAAVGLAGGVLQLVALVLIRERPANPGRPA